MWHLGQAIAAEFDMSVGLEGYSSTSSCGIAKVVVIGHKWT